MSIATALLVGGLVGFLIAVVLAVLLRGAGDPNETNAAGPRWTGDWL